MKKILLVGALFLSSACFSAESDVVSIATNESRSAEWVYYANTLEKLSDGYSVMSGKRTKSSPEARGFFGISFVDCRSGYGTLMTRDTIRENWTIISTVSMSDPVTVSDRLAKVLCDAGSSAFGKSKKKKI